MKNYRNGVFVLTLILFTYSFFGISLVKLLFDSTLIKLLLNYLTLET